MHKSTKIQWRYLLLMSTRMFFAIGLVCTLSGVLMAEPGNSQDLSTIKVDVRATDVTLTEIFTQIEKQTSFRFSFTDEIKDINHISLNVQSKRLDLLLKELSSLADVSFKQINEMIAVAKAKKGKGTTPLRADVTVSGLVSDAVTGDPIPGVNVLVKGTTNGTTTDAAGRFTLVVKGDEVIVVSFIGYKTQEVTIGSQISLDIRLESGAEQLSEVVVTALGIERDKKSLGYVVQDMGTEEISKARETNVLNSLSGRMAGVQITNGPSSIGGSARIVIRGEKSLGGNSQPLFIVDGVPVSNNLNGTRGETIDFGNGISEINPDNIESITVLKGANAAALYGSRAANGVVVIKSKSGSLKSKIGVSLNSNFMNESILKMWDFQTNYGEGLNGQFSYVNGAGGGIQDGTAYNWGPPMDGQLIPQFDSPIDAGGNRVSTPFVNHPDNLKKDFLQNGKIFTNTVSLSGGNEKGQFRASVTNLTQSGIIPNTDLERNTFALNASYLFTDRLRMEVSSNLVKSGSDNLPMVSYSSGNLMYAFIWFPRSVNVNSLRNYWKPGREGLEQQNYDNNWTDNLFFTVYENRNSFEKTRGFGNLKLTYNLTDHLSLMVRSGIDFYDELREQRRAFSTKAFRNGRYIRQDISFEENNTDFLLNFNKPLNQDLNFSLSLGGNRMNQKQRDNNHTAPELSIPGIYNLQNSRVALIVEQTSFEKRINSFYGSLDLGYRDYLFLSVTGRNDWSSTLPKENNSYFYPSVSLSGVLSELISLEETPVSFLKVRASVAQVGSDTDPYRLQNVYNYAQPWGSSQTVVESSTIANPDLKPEITTSYEYGLDVGLWGDRLNLGATYYSGNSRNQILAVPLSATTTYTQRFINAGEIQNKGVELVLSGSPLKRSAFSWDVSINYSANRNKIIALADGIQTFVQSSVLGGSLQARVGGSMGDIYGRVFQRDPDGNIIYSGGLPQLTTDVAKVGNANPDWMAGIQNTIRYKSFTLGFLFDVRQGGEVYNLSFARAIGAGTLAESDIGNFRTEGIVGEGVIKNADGSFRPNDVRVDYFPYTRAYYNFNNVESTTFDASFVKLREVRLDYKVAKRIIAKTPFESITFSLVGRNLFLWDNVPHIDPESYSLGGSTVRTGLEEIRLPSTRTYGFNLNINL